MNHTRIALEDQVVALIYPAKLHSDIVALFGKFKPRIGAASHTIIIREEKLGKFCLKVDGDTRYEGLTRDKLLICLVGESVEALIAGINGGVVIHSAAVATGGTGIILPGETGSGKSCLSAWLAHRGFEYLTDECVVLQPKIPLFTALTRPALTKNYANRLTLHEIAETEYIVSGSEAIFWPEHAATGNPSRRCDLVLFPRFDSQSDISIKTLTAAQTAFELTACNVNARNLPDHGLKIVTSFAREVPGIMVRYGNFQQFEGALESISQQLSQRLH